jgi:hypothetical protein
MERGKNKNMPSRRIVRTEILDDDGKEYEFVAEFKGFVSQDARNKRCTRQYRTRHTYKTDGFDALYPPLFSVKFEKQVASDSGLLLLLISGNTV